MGRSHRIINGYTSLFQHLRSSQTLADLEAESTGVVIQRRMVTEKVMAYTCCWQDNSALNVCCPSGSGVSINRLTSNKSGQGQSEF